MPSIRPVELDGSTLEGGGQLVRVALSLSAITGIPVTIHNIRANRGPSRWPKSKGILAERKGTSKKKTESGGNRKVEGGLKESHLAAVLWLAERCNAFTDGAENGSRTLEFVPGAGHSGSTSREKKVKDDNDRLVDSERNVISLKNPGSVWLILQALLPFLIFSNYEHQNVDTNSTESFTELTLKGGTNVPKSTSADYFIHVFLPTMERIGVPKVEVELLKRGWAGNAATVGEVKIRVQQSQAGGFSLPSFHIFDRGKLEKITVKIVARLSSGTETLEAELRSLIANHLGNEVQVEMLGNEDSGAPQRLYLLLIAHTTNGWRLGSDFLGSGKTPKNNAEEKKILTNACETVVRNLKNELKRGGCVDEFMQDQLVIFQTLAKGDSVVDGGEWTNTRDTEHDEECGDEAGSLHTRTVRWVCEQMLRRHRVSVRFKEGGLCEGIAWNGGHEENFSKSEQEAPVVAMEQLRLKV